MKSLASLFLILFLDCTCLAQSLVDVDFEWETVLGAKSYQVELIDQQTKKTFTEVSKTEHFQFKIPIGKYRMRGRAADYRKVFGDWSPYTDLVIGPTPVKTKSDPLPETLASDRKLLHAEKHVEWLPNPNASGYRIELLDAAGKVIASKLTNKTEANFKLKPGEYKIQVVTLSKEGIDSEPTLLSPKLSVSKSKFQTPKILVDEKTKSFRLEAENPKAIKYRIEYQRHLSTLNWQTMSEGDSTAYEEFVKKPLPAGKYRVLVWLESEGFGKSDPATYDYVIKPSETDL